MRKLAPFLFPLFLAIATIIPSLSFTQAQAQSTDLRFFSQTNFRIDNDAFWNFFNGRGGINTFGYPVSQQFQLQGFPVQIFQRAVMQLQADGGVQTLNLLDSGVMPYTSFNGSTFPAPSPTLVSQTPPVSDTNYTTDILNFVNQNAPDTFNGQPVDFDQTFNNTVSYATAFPNNDGDPSLVPLFDLQIWGAPTSAPAYDPNNHNFVYQRFQRGIMHYDATCNCTEGILLADYFKSILTGQNLPPDLAAEAQNSVFYKQYDPTKPLSLARPSALPNSDLTNAFVAEQPSSGSSGSASATATPAAGATATPAAGTSTAAPQAGPNSKIGYGYNVEMWDFNQPGKQLVVNLVNEAGFNWITQQVNWDAVETSPGVYDWSQVDAIVSTANQAGLKVLLTVNEAPTFYRSSTSGMMPSDPTKLGTFMGAMATRYKGQVQAYQIWNEENLDREAGTGNVNPSTYLPLLQDSYTAIKAADSNALVVLGPPSPTGVDTPGSIIDDVTYLTQLYALNNGAVKNYYDVLGAHPSGFSNPPNCGPSTPQCSLSSGWNNDPSFFAFYRVSQYNQIMTQNGEGNKKIWFTEFGYDSMSNPPPGYGYASSISSQQQAQFLVQAYQIAAQTPYVGNMFTWNLDFQVAVPPTDEKYGFGVLNPDWSPRAAFSALASMPKP